MKNIIRLFSLLSFTLASAVLKADNLPFIDPTPGEITIMASTPIPDGVTPTRQAYIDLVNAGFNLGITNGSVDYFKNQFELIGGLDFKYLVKNDLLLTDRREEVIDALKDYKQLGGWVFLDEPHYDRIPELSTLYRRLYAADPSHMIFMNLVGSVIKIFTGPLTEYSQYLDYIQAKFQPMLWSYDLYPFSEQKGKVEVKYNLFYYDLEQFKRISQTTGRPFWTYLQSMELKIGNYYMPAAKEEYLRFVAFSSLAYGAQGILYWTYGQRYSGGNEEYLSALVNLNGEKTNAWYAAKKVNWEIKRFNHVFYKCKVLDLQHTGDRLYKGTRKLSGEFGSIKMVRSGASGVVISRIENKEGKRYIVIVNRNVLKNQKVTVELKPNSQIKDITLKKEVIHNWRNDITFTLDKGGYKIFEEI